MFGKTTLAHKCYDVGKDFTIHKLQNVPGVDKNNLQDLVHKDMLQTSGSSWLHEPEHIESHRLYPGLTPQADVAPVDSSDGPSGKRADSQAP